MVKKINQLFYIGIFTLMVLLIQTVGLTVVLTVIPLWWFHRSGLRIHGRNRYLAYFSGLARQRRVYLTCLTWACAPDSEYE